MILFYTRNGLRETGGLSFLSRKGALTHHPQAGGGMAFGHRALSEGDCGSCTARPALLSSSMQPAL